MGRGQIAFLYTDYRAWVLQAYHTTCLEQVLVGFKAWKLQRSQHCLYDLG